MNRYNLGAISLLLLVSLSCGISDLEFTNVEGTTISPQVALNIGNVNYTIADLVEDIESESLEVVDGEDFFLSVVYQDTNYYADLERLLKINDVTNQANFQPLPTDISGGGPAQEIDQDRDFEFSIPAEGGKEIDSVYFKSGTLEFTVTSDFDFDVDYVFRMLDVRTLDDNEPIVFSGTLNAANPVVTETRDINGTKLVSNPTTGSNIFLVNLAVTLHVPANTPVSASDGFSINLFFDDPVTRAAFGDFGQETLDLFSTSVDVSSLNDLGEGSLEFYSPTLVLEIENELGVELDLFFDKVKAETDDADITLEGEVVDNPQFVDSPNYEQIGQVIRTDLFIDNTNSNLADLINGSPENLIFDVSGMPNPEAGDNIRNFIHDDDSVEIRSIMEIPFELKMDGFQREVEFSTPDALDEADYVTLLLTTQNQIPINGRLDLSFRDANDNEIFLLAGAEILESPPIGSDGRTTTIQEKRSQIDLEGEALEAFLASDKIVCIIVIDSFEEDAGRFVKFFSDYQLLLDLSVIGQITVSL